MVRKVATKEIAPLARELDEKAAFPEHARNVFAELGLLNPLLPAAFDGPEMGVLTTVLIMEEISRVCAATALLLIAQSDGMLPILHGGSPELKKRFLGRLGGGSTVLTALAATEPTAGSDLLGMKTRAVRKGDEYVINGQKCFITNGSVADVIPLYAYTDPDKGAKGISAFVVEKGTPGLSYGRNEVKMGMRGSINSELFFEDLRIPVANRIGEEGTGFANLMSTLTMNRIFCAAQAVGIAQGALDEAIHHARERVQFGKAISHIAVVQSMIADMAAAVESSRLLTRKAAALFDKGDAKQGALYRLARQDLRQRQRHEGDHRRGPGPGRLRLHEGPRRRADDARRQAHPDLHGHQPDHAHRGRTSAAALRIVSAPHAHHPTRRARARRRPLRNRRAPEPAAAAAARPRRKPMTPHRWMMTAVGQPLVKEPLELAAPPPGQVLVEVAGCGVCHTDLGFLYDGVRTNQPLPLALGHEVSGRVVKAGAGRGGLARGRPCWSRR